MGVLAGTQKYFSLPDKLLLTRNKYAYAINKVQQAVHIGGFRLLD
jgi:hypothetical protein